MRRFYFTTETMCDDECWIPDHRGNIRGARTIAQRYANELNEIVYINEGSDIVDCIYPD